MIFLQTMTPKTETVTRLDGGVRRITHAAGGTSYPCSLQWDNSGDAQNAYIQEGGIGGKLYYPSSVTLTTDQRVDVGGQEIILKGPEVIAPGATAKWAPVQQVTD